MLSVPVLSCHSHLLSTRGRERGQAFVPPPSASFVLLLLLLLRAQTFKLLRNSLQRLQNFLSDSCRNWAELVAGELWAQTNVKPKGEIAFCSTFEDEERRRWLGATPKWHALNAAATAAVALSVETQAAAVAQAAFSHMRVSVMMHEQKTRGV